MLCQASPWTAYAINGTLCVAVVLIVWLMQKAEHDQQINRIDARRIRAARRISFVSVAMFAFVTVLTDVSSTALLLLFISTAVLLAVDILALQHRPPHNGHRAVAAGGYAYPLRRVIAFFRR